MSVLFINNYTTTTASYTASTSTSIQLIEPLPLVFSVGDYCYLTLASFSGSVEIAREVVKVTAAADGEITVTRGQDGTTALNWPAGTIIEMRLVSQYFNNDVATKELVQTLHDAQQEAIALLAGASASFYNNVSTVVPESPASKVNLVWTNGQSSSNASVLELGTNEILFKKNGNYNFLNTLTFYRLSAGSVCTVTFELYDADTNAILASYDQAIDMPAGTKITMPFNVVLGITGTSEDNPVRMKVRMGMTAASGTLELFSFNSIITAQSIASGLGINDNTVSTTSVWSSDKTYSTAMAMSLVLS